MILVGCSSGMVALVGGTDAEEEAFTRLTHPKPVVTLNRIEAYPVLLKSGHGSSQRSEEQTSTADPVVVHDTPEERPLVSAPVTPRPDPKPQAPARTESTTPCQGHPALQCVQENHARSAQPLHLAPKRRAFFAQQFLCQERH